MRIRTDHCRPHRSRADVIRPLAGVLAAAVLAAACTPVAANPTPSTSHTQPAARPSLALGTNLALYDPSDQVLNDRTTQRVLKDARVPIIRMPFRSRGGDIVELEALRAIQYLGAIPLVIVHGPDDPGALEHDSQLIALVKSVFGNGVVYVEFGNEPDLAGYGVARYLAAWNGVVPTLSRMAPTYRFLGPALGVFNPTYLGTFDQGADPRPYANSWHEYACEPTDPDAYCLSQLASWTGHIDEAGQAVRTATGATVPVLITEWNLDGRPDPRYGDQTFMGTWTVRALQTLAAGQTNGLIAAMQYCVTNDGPLSLIGPGGTLTAQGSVFFQALASSGRRRDR